MYYVILQNYNASSQYPSSSSSLGPVATATDVLQPYGLFTHHIQSDSGGICTTLGDDSMSDSKQKSSYEHGSDFERLRS